MGVAIQTVKSALTFREWISCHFLNLYFLLWCLEKWKAQLSVVSQVERKHQLARYDPWHHGILSTD